MAVPTINSCSVEAIPYVDPVEANLLAQQAVQLVHREIISITFASSAHASGNSNTISVHRFVCSGDALKLSRPDKV